MPNTVHSFVIPVFNERETLPVLKRRLDHALRIPLAGRNEACEMVFVDDGSTDGSFEYLETLHHENPQNIKVIAFSRNFGHQAAITAGLDHSIGDTVTVMDADLQDPPETALQMIEKWREGYDVVFAVRRQRQNEGLFKQGSAKLFYRMLRFSCQLEIPIDAGDFRLLSRSAADSLRSLREKHRFVRGMAKWIGFRQGYVFYNREPRYAGETKYPFKKMLQLAWDAFTGFSLLPLRLATYAGLVTSMASVGVLIWILYIKFFTQSPVTGWASLMIAILFIGGIQLFTIGILGEYVGRVFEQSKGRPLYLVQKALIQESQIQYSSPHAPRIHNLRNRTTPEVSERRAA